MHLTEHPNHTLNTTGLRDKLLPMPRTNNSHCPNMIVQLKSFVLSISIWLSTASVIAQSYPDGFAEEIAYTQFGSPSGYIPAMEGLAFVIELDGKLWAIRNGVVDSTPLLNISDEVGMWADLGMISATLHPDFQSNGYIYLLYNVDRYHLLHSEDPDYDPTQNDYYRGGMGRVTRYTVNTDNFTEIDPLSRLVIHGAEIGEGVPLCSDSHGLGTIAFGEDGSLIISTGDTNSYWCCYNGNGPVPVAAYDSISYNDGILRADELIGAFRSQYLDGLNGKLLRIHPETGEGLPGNPYFDPSDPTKARSQVWALGFRNPFRFTIKPNTGYGNLENGHPGVIYLTDVGESKWEEINIVRDPGTNFGWPIFEGPFHHTAGYPNLITYNQSAPNPLYGEGGCDQEYFSFQDLLVQENEQHDYFFSNPCNEFQEIPSDIPTFSLERPAIAYMNQWGGPIETYVPTFNEQGTATVSSISNSDSPVTGQIFNGSSGNGGVFLSGDFIPDSYHNQFILSDFMGWVRAFSTDEFGAFENIEMWQDSIGRAVHITQDPYDGCIYISTVWPSYIKRICFGGNLKPIVHLTPDTIYGTSPLMVNFDASTSYDPEGENLVFHWDFGDGTQGTGAQVSHQYEAVNGQTQSFIAKVTVNDESGTYTEETALVSLNNTPPEVNISSIVEGELYSNSFPTLFSLIAETRDAEHTESQLDIEWTYLLRHNTHFHVLDRYTGNDLELVVYPTACEDEVDYWYEINVRVTDPGGLSTISKRNIYADCDGVLNDPNGNGANYSIGPNPTNGFIELRSFIGLENQIEFQIYSPEGKLVFEKTVSIYNNRQYCQLDISELQQGTYILEFSLGGKKYQERIVKIDY